MMTTLAHGLDVIREWARTIPLAKILPAHMEDRLSQDLAFEAHKFLVFREWRMHEHQAVSIHRMRSILVLLAGVHRHPQPA